MTAKLLLAIAAVILAISCGMAAAQSSPGPLSNEPVADASRALSVRDAVAIALEKNPQRKIELAHSDLAKTQWRLARTALFPTLQFDETIQRGNDPVYVFGTHLRQQRFTQADFALNVLNRPAPANDFTTRFSGSWTAFDSFATQRRIRRSDLLAKSASAALTRSDQETVHATVQAYEAVLFALRQAEVAQYALTTAEALEKSSSDRVEAGLAVDADRIAATAYLAERRQEQIAADGQVQIAWAELESSLGSAVPAERRRLLPLPERELAVTPLDEAMAQALRTRPDRQAVTLQRDAAVTSVGEAKSAFGPKISSFGSWETDRVSFAGSGGNNWVAGAELRLNILPLAERQNLASAHIRQREAEASIDSADQQIRLDVTRAFYRLASAKQSLVVARTSAQQTDEGLRIAKDRYESGLGTMTDLLRTEDLQRQSQTNYWQAVFRTALAYADLQFANGTLNQDAAGDLQ